MRRTIAFYIVVRILTIKYLSMKIYIQIMILLSLLSLSSCKDWLNLQPEGEATSDKLFTTGDGYRSVLAGVYEAMASRNLYGVELQFDWWTVCHGNIPGLGNMARRGLICIR